MRSGARADHRPCHVPGGPMTAPMAVATRATHKYLRGVATMKSLHIIRYAAVAAAALALTACSTATAQHPAAGHPATHTAAPSPPSAQAQADAAAKANDRTFSYGEAASVIDARTLRATVAGPVMTHYAMA